MACSTCGCTCVWQVKLWSVVNMCHTWARHLASWLVQPFLHGSWQWQTEAATASVTIGRIYVRSTAMQPDSACKCQICHRVDSKWTSDQGGKNSAWRNSFEKQQQNSLVNLPGTASSCCPAEWSRQCRRLCRSCSEVGPLLWTSTSPWQEQSQ